MITLVIVIFITLTITSSLSLKYHIQRQNFLKLKGSKFPDENGFVPKRTTPKPKIITPNRGTSTEIEKFMMMYTCKVRFYISIGNL